MGLFFNCAVFCV